jgi:hypothetical protein
MEEMVSYQRGPTTRRHLAEQPKYSQPRALLAEQPAAADALQRPLRSRFQARLSRSVMRRDGGAHE